MIVDDTYLVNCGLLFARSRALPFADALVLAQGDAPVVHPMDERGWRGVVDGQAGAGLVIKDRRHQAILAMQIGIVPPCVEAIGRCIEQGGTDEAIALLMLIDLTIGGHEIPQIAIRPCRPREHVVDEKPSWA